MRRGGAPEPAEKPRGPTWAAAPTKNCPPRGGGRDTLPKPRREGARHDPGDGPALTPQEPRGRGGRPGLERADGEPAVYEGSGRGPPRQAEAGGGGGKRPQDDERPHPERAPKGPGPDRGPRARGGRAEGQAEGPSTAAPRGQDQRGRPPGGIGVGRIAITGTASFLGSRLLRRLVASHDPDSADSRDIVAPPASAPRVRRHV